MSILVKDYIKFNVGGREGIAGKILYDCLGNKNKKIFRIKAFDFGPGEA